MTCPASGTHSCACHKSEDGVLAYFGNLGFSVEPWTPTDDNPYHANHRCRLDGRRMLDNYCPQWTAESPLQLWSTWQAENIFDMQLFRDHRLAIYSQRFREGDDVYRAALWDGIRSRGPMPGFGAFYDEPKLAGCPVERLASFRPWCWPGSGENISILYIKNGLTRFAEHLLQERMEAERLFLNKLLRVPFGGTDCGRRL